MLGSHHVEVGMLSTTRYTRPVGLLVVIAVCLGGLTAANAQITRDDFVTGVAAAAWERWQIAMTAILARDAEAAETAFGQLLKAEPSAFRIAMMAERTVMHTGQGGAVLLLEQDAESNALQANGQRVTELLEVGREQVNQADDGWYFAAVGRFDAALIYEKAAHGRRIAVLPPRLQPFDRHRHGGDLKVRVPGDARPGPGAVEEHAEPIRGLDV